MRTLLTALVLLMIAASVNAADPFVGTYKLNAAKSTMSGAPATAEMTLTIAEDGDDLVVIPSRKRIDGVVLSGRLVVPKAGGTAKAPGGEVAYDSAIVTRLNPNTLEVVTMREGKAGVRVELALSADGKTLSRSIKSMNPSGQRFEGVSVLERQ